MKTITINLYEFGELAEDVRKKIAEDKCFKVMEWSMDGCNPEYEASLEAFKEATGFGARGWRVGYYEHHFRRTDPDYAIMGSYAYPLYADDIKGRLLWRWCYRFVQQNRRGAWFSTSWDRKKRILYAGRGSAERRSRILKESITGGWTPWTGVCTDCPLVEPIVDFYLSYHRGKYREDYTLADLVDDCLEKFFDEWESEYNAYGDNKDGCVEEWIEANSDGDWYYADGRKFEGDIDELKTA